MGYTRVSTDADFQVLHLQHDACVAGASTSVIWPRIVSAVAASIVLFWRTPKVCSVIARCNRRAVLPRRT